MFKRRPPPKQVSQDIQNYVFTATLPELRLNIRNSHEIGRMPESGHKTHRNRLSVTIMRNRLLSHTQQIRSKSFDESVKEFISKHFPSSPVAEDDADPETEDQPYLAAPGYIISNSIRPRALRNIDSLGVAWIQDHVLATAERVVQMVPEYQFTRDWSFTTPDVLRDIDSKLFRFFMWEKNINSAGPSNEVDPFCSLIVAYQPPWILSSRDLDQIVQIRSIPKYNPEAGPNQERLISAHKVWIKLHEVCKERNCRTFVLTNYTEWVFGSFSPGWTYGSITNVKHARGSSKNGVSNPKHKTSPSVLSCLIFWLLSSMRVPDHYEMPAVPESIDVDMSDNENIDPSQRRVLGERQVMTFYAPSESIWTRKSEEAPESAGVNIDMESESGNTPPPFMNENWVASDEPTRAMKKQIRTTVNQWTRANHPTRFASPDPILPPPSPVMSEWSDVSTATVRASHSQAFISLQPLEEDVREYVFDNED